MMAICHLLSICVHQSLSINTNFLALIYSKFCKVGMIIILIFQIKKNRG